MTTQTPHCMAPFTSIIIDKNGELLPCCEFTAGNSNIPQGHIRNFSQWWDHDIQALRNKMIQQELDSGCSHCIKKESLGQNSIRKNHNQQFSTVPIDEPILPVRRIEIRLGNYCNLCCIMCGEYASSSIATEYSSNQDAYNKIGVVMSTTANVAWWKDPQCMENLKTILQQVQYCGFAGGEPFIVPEMANILKMLDPLKIKNMHIISSLNNVSASAINSLRDFQTVNISASIEGIGEHNNYVRYGSDWGAVLRNIELLQQNKNIKLNVSHVLQHTSVWALPMLLSWAETQNMVVTLGEVFYQSYPAPGVLTINSVHPTDLAKFKEWLLQYRGPSKTILESWVNQYQYNPQLNQQFHQYTAMLDGIRGTNFKSVFNPTYENF
jgi:radical SAM protein with 4Fe4S-binding SPASM domain